MRCTDVYVVDCKMFLAEELCGDRNLSSVPISQAMSLGCPCLSWEKEGNFCNSDTHLEEEGVILANHWLGGYAFLC